MHYVTTNTDCYPLMQSKKIYTTKLKANKINKIEEETREWKSKFDKIFDPARRSSNSSLKVWSSCVKSCNAVTEKDSLLDIEINKIKRGDKTPNFDTYDPVLQNLRDIDSNNNLNRNRILTFKDTIDIIALALDKIELTVKAALCSVDSIKEKISNISLASLDEYNLNLRNIEEVLLKKLDDINIKLSSIGIRLQPMIRKNSLSETRLTFICREIEFKIFERWNIEVHYDRGKYKTDSAKFNRDEVFAKINEIVRFYQLYRTDTVYTECRFQIILDVSGFVDHLGFDSIKRKRLERELDSCLPNLYYLLNNKQRKDTLNYCLSYARATHFMKYIKDNIEQNPNIKIGKSSAHAMGYKYPNTSRNYNQVEDDQESRITKVICYIVAWEDRK